MTHLIHLIQYKLEQQVISVLLRNQNKKVLNDFSDFLTAVWDCCRLKCTSPELVHCVETDVFDTPVPCTAAPWKSTCTSWAHSDRISSLAWALLGDWIVIVCDGRVWEYVFFLLLWRGFKAVLRLIKRQSALLFFSFLISLQLVVQWQ